MRPPFSRLHLAHRSCTFFPVLLLPFETGMMWSNSDAQQCHSSRSEDVSSGPPWPARYFLREHRPLWLLERVPHKVANSRAQLQVRGLQTLHGPKALRLLEGHSVNEVAHRVRGIKHLEVKRLESSAWNCYRENGLFL